jgi:hypothetical protein
MMIGSDIQVILILPQVFDFDFGVKMFATLDKAKPSTENIKGLNLAAVICMTVQVSRLPW